MTIRTNIRDYVRDDPDDAIRDDDPDDIIWGVAAIARQIGRSPAQVYHLIRIGALNGAVRKLSHKIIVASRSALRRLPLQP
jgi:hypothetical protein